jgi:hypothetical protein
MIKGITGGRYLNVINGSPATTHIGNYSNQPGLGNVRYNPNSQNIEICDGNSWQIMNTSYATVELDYEARELLDWAREKRNEDLKLKELLEKHPAVRDLKEKLDVTVALVTEQAKQGE